MRAATKDATISVRLPSSLSKELKQIATKNHYVDLSEQIRDVIRQKNNKYLVQESRTSKTSQSTAPKDKEQIMQEKLKLISELQKIIQELNKGL